MVKRIISAAFLFLPLWVAAQNCNICPSGTTVTLQSTYPPAATHYWSCTNGFTSNLVSPTFTPAADVTCTLVVTDASGCTSTSQTIVDICNCDCNDPCVSMNYNSTTDCVTFNNTGSNCSPVATDVIEWKNQNTSYATIANGSQICNCDIKEYVNTSAAVTINGSDFRLTINGLQNRCSTCSGSNMRIDFQFPLSGSTSSFPGCAATTDWLTISPAQFATNGYVCDAYVRYTTPFGIVVNQYRFQYNGGGLNVANVTVTEIVKRTIYKDITARRTVTYTDGCPQEQCEILLDIPQQPNDPCTHFVAYVSNVNIGAPCNGPGYNANTINGTAPITYQWYYNGTLLTGQTGQFFCLVGQPFGTYCVQITDAAGCTENVCRVYQASCNLTASITLSGTTLTAVLTGCTGTATYQWQRWNGTAWVNVGTNASTYNTGGVAGDYRVNVTCSGPPVCNAIATYTYTPPCTADVTITTGTTTLTANVTGCGGVNITYVWDRWNGTAWVTVQTVTTTSTSNVYTPTLSGLYRVTITCGSCSDQAQTSWTAPNPCTGFSAAITGTFTGLCVGTAYTYNRTITGGTAPYTQTWKVNGTTVGTGTSYTYTPTAVGTYTLTVTVVDANNCSYTDTKTLTVINCCGLSVSLSPDITVCVNQSGTFTATPTGGTAPITYSWTSQLPPAAPVSQGTGNPKSLTFATAGTYTVQVTATDANNCTAVASRNMVVQNCTNCTCTPTLTLVGCQLQGGTTGAGCGNFSYQLQYSPTGTGWTTVLSGVAFNGWTFTHTPAANGVYRLVIFATGCNLQQTPDVVVNCVPNCSCTAGTLTFASCNLTWTNPCSGAGYTADLEYFDGTSWVYVTQTTPYVPPISGQYRVAYKKGGCTTVYSVTVTATLTVCISDFYYTDGISIYKPSCKYFHRAHQQNSWGGTVANMYRFSIGIWDWSNSAYTINWGDGSSNYTGTVPTNVDHTFATNGIYLPNYTRTYFGQSLQNKWFVNADGDTDPNTSGAYLNPKILDGSEPILYSYKNCTEVYIYLDFEFTAINYLPTYQSHYVKIDGVNYTIPITFTQTLFSSTLWNISNYLGTQISIPYDTNVHTVELGVTFNGQTVINKGFFIMCNSCT